PHAPPPPASSTLSLHDALPISDQPEPFQHAWFVRDYDMSGTCNFDETAVWSLWSWAATTPEDSRVEFYVRTAMTRAGLDTAPQRSEEHTSELQSRENLVCRLLR